MPHYYFYVHDGVEVQDREGLELPDMNAARAYALRLAGETIRDAGIRGSSRDDWDVVVTDHAGLILFRMAFIVSASAAAAAVRKPIAEPDQLGIGEPGVQAGSGVPR